MGNGEFVCFCNYDGTFFVTQFKVQTVWCCFVPTSKSLVELFWLQWTRPWTTVFGADSVSKHIRYMQNEISKSDPFLCFLLIYFLGAWSWNEMSSQIDEDTAATYFMIKCLHSSPRIKNQSTPFAKKVRSIVVWGKGRFFYSCHWWFRGLLWRCRYCCNDERLSMYRCDNSRYGYCCKSFRIKAVSVYSS